MKQNKRFWLIALAVLLATILVSGLALAADENQPNPIEKLDGGERVDGKNKTTYTFYAVKDPQTWPDTKTYVGLVDARVGAIIDPFTLNVIPNQDAGAKLGDIRFTWNQQTGSANSEFMFKSSSKALKLDNGDVEIKEENAQRDTKLTWDKKTLGTFTLTVTAVNEKTRPDETGVDKPYPADNSDPVVFTIIIKQLDVDGLKIMNKLNSETTGIFNYYIDEKQVGVGRDAGSYLRLVEKYVDFDPEVKNPQIHVGKYPMGNDDYLKISRASWEAYATDIAYEIVYDPTNVAYLIENRGELGQAIGRFVKDAEKDVAGFTVVASDSNVGWYDQNEAVPSKRFKPIKQYVEKKNPTYYKWTKAEGAATVTIKAVDEKENVLTKFGSAVASVNFIVNKEDTVTIRALAPKDPTKTVVPTIGVGAEKDAYYGYYDDEGIANGFVLDVDITDPNNNKVDPTYHNPDIDIIWSSSDPEILRVTKDGRMTGIKVGEAYLIATSKLGVKGKLLVKVVDKEKSKITKLAFNQEPAVYNLAYGAQRPVAAYLIFTPRYYDTYTVTSANSSIVSVGTSTVWNDTDDGPEYDGWYATIKGVSVGTTTITVTPDGKPELAVTATINVVNAPKFAFDKEEYEGNAWSYVDVSATAADFEADFDDDTWVLESSDTDVVANQEGELVWDPNYGEKKLHTNFSIYAKNPGTATVTLKNKNDPSISASTVIVVKQGKFALSLKKDSVKLYFTKAAGDDSNTYSNNVSFTDLVKSKPSGNVVKDVEKWSFKTSNKKVAVVSVNGTIEATGAGEAVITGTYDDGVNKAELELKVVVETVDSKVDPDDPEPAKANPIEVEVDQYYIMVVKGGDNTLPATAYDKVTGEEVDVTWSSSDRKLATVSKSGVITGKGAGKVVITATTKDGTQKFSIGVKILHKPVEKIKTDSAITLVKGEKYTPVIEIEPKHAYDSSLSFKSDNKKVATVNENGTITAKKPGNANITVKAKDGSGVTAVIKVTVTK